MTERGPLLMSSHVIHHAVYAFMTRLGSTSSHFQALHEALSKRIQAAANATWLQGVP